MPLHSWNTRSTVRLGAATLALTACAGRSPAPDAAPAPVAAPASSGAATPTAAAGATRFTWSAGERRLEVRTDALVTRDGPTGPTGPTAPGTPAPASDSEHVVTVAYISAALGPAAAPGAVDVQGTVDSLIVSASGRVRGAAAANTPAASASATSAILTAFRYRAASDARGVRVEAADPGIDLRCTAPAGAASLGALAAVREALPRIPTDLAAGARWRDTTVTASCAGPVLLVAQTVAHYESAADPVASGRLLVTRQSTTTARGQGTAGVRPMSVVATGTARTVYALDPSRGQLVDGTGEGRTTVAVTVSGVAQRFIQQTRTQVTVR